MRKPDERITKKEFNSIAAQGQDLEDDEDADGLDVSADGITVIYRADDLQLLAGNEVQPEGGFFPPNS